MFKLRVGIRFILRVVCTKVQNLAGVPNNRRNEQLVRVSYLFFKSTDVKFICLIPSSEKIELRLYVFVSSLQDKIDQIQGVEMFRRRVFEQAYDLGFMWCENRRNEGLVRVSHSTDVIFILFNTVREREHMPGQSMLALCPASSVISSWWLVQKASKESPRAVGTKLKTAARETTRAGNPCFKTPISS